MTQYNTLISHHELPLQHSTHWLVDLEHLALHPLLQEPRGKEYSMESTQYVLEELECGWCMTHRIVAEFSYELMYGYVIRMELWSCVVPSHYMLTSCQERERESP